MTTVDFADWLEGELQGRRMRPIDLAKKADIDNGVISRILSRERQPSAETLIAIARGFSLPYEFVLRVAGVLPPKPDSDDVLQKIEELYHSLQDPSNRQKGLEYFEFLRSSEEKTGSRSPRPPKRRPTT